MTSQADEAPRDTGEKSFLDHLEDLRATLLVCAGWLGLGILIAVPLTPWAVGVLKAPLARTGVNPDTFLRVLHVTSGLTVAMKTAFWGGLLLAIPGMVYAVARFVVPGLTARETRVARQAMGFAALLFMGGVAMGYFMTLPVALRMLFRINRWLGVEADFVELSDYIAFVLKLLIAFGLAFELPVVVTALGAAGLVSSAQLAAGRNYVIVGIMIVAMLLTPPDPLTLLMMAVPMWLLYELCIVIIRFNERRAQA